MSRALSNSFQAVYVQIKRTGGFWEQSLNGKWYHNYNPADVKRKLEGIQVLIDHYWSSHNPLYEWIPVEDT